MEFQLNATLSHAELVEQAIQIQDQIKLKLDDLNKSQQLYKSQVQQNKMLKEYVDNLLQTTNKLGTK